MNSKLRAETAPFELKGDSTRAFLGAEYTGRSIDVEVAYPAAKRWLEAYEKSLEPNLNLEAQFLNSLTSASEDVFDRPWFRGRWLSKPPECEDQFGPPPPEDAGPGRYNAQGEPALYLCSSCDGVKREIGEIVEGKQLWIQEFRIPPETRLADARSLPRDSLAAAVLWLIESARDRAIRPQLGVRIVQIVGSHYDGIIVPGVRGDPDALYSNLVLFRPADRWRSFVNASAPPENAS